VSEDGIQPIYGKNKFGPFFFVFNGNIPCNDYDNSYTLDSIMIRDFFINNAINCSNWSKLLQQFVIRFKRAYSIILFSSEDIYLIKDRFGVRPLCYSFSNDKQILEISSESVGLSYKNPIQEVKPGEILLFNTRNIKTPLVIFNYNETNNISNKYGGKCIFEYVYFLNPNTIWNNIHVDAIRAKWANKLSEIDIELIQNNIKEDYLVIGIPSTGIVDGIKYADKLGLNYFQAITKNSKVNRTFILSKEERDIVSKKKYIYDSDKINGKKVIILDDSIVRGVTMKNMVGNIFDCGAAEVHIRIISPEITNICKYGKDIPTCDELIAANMDNKQMTKYFGATSLIFLDIFDMLDTIDPYINKKTICSGCFGGSYGDVEDIKDICNKRIKTIDKQL